MDYLKKYKSFLYSYYLSAGVRITIGVVLPALALSFFDMLQIGTAISLGALCFGVRSGKPKKPQLIPGCRFLMSVDVSSQDSFIFLPSHVIQTLREHLNESSQAINWSWEPGGKRKKEGTRRSVFRNMRCSQRSHSLLIHLPPIR